jgi:hypothetical protein
VSQFLAPADGEMMRDLNDRFARMFHFTPREVSGVPHARVDRAVVVAAVAVRPVATIPESPVAGVPATTAGADAPRRDARRVDALPAGHPVTWGAITAGTVLAAEAYQH